MLPFGVRHLISITCYPLARRMLELDDPLEEDDLDLLPLCETNPARADVSVRPGCAMIGLQPLSWCSYFTKRPRCYDLRVRFEDTIHRAQVRRSPACA